MYEVISQYCFKQDKQKLRDLHNSPDVSRWPN